MSKTGMIYIRTAYHNLFCSIFEVKYDRVGFIYDDFLWLYWALPTTADPFIGIYDKLDITDSKVMYAKLTNKVNEDEFMESLRRLSHNITSFEEQIAPNGVPYGIIAINSVLAAIGSDNIKNDRVEIQYDLFFPPKLYEEGNENNGLFGSPCVDLVQHIMSNPSITKQKFTITKSTYDEVIAKTNKLILSIFKGQIDYNELMALKSDIQRISPEEFQQDSEEKDPFGVTDLIVVMDKNSTIKTTIKNFRAMLSKMVGPTKDYVEIDLFVANCNKILKLFSAPPVDIKIPKTQSYIIATTNSYKSTIQVPLGADSNILEIPLSGEHLEKLKTEDLVYLLQAMDSMESEDARFDDLRALITSKVYAGKKT